MNNQSTKATNTMSMMSHNGCLVFSVAQLMPMSLQRHIQIFKFSFSCMKKGQLRCHTFQNTFSDMNFSVWSTFLKLSQYFSAITRSRKALFLTSFCSAERQQLMHLALCQSRKKNEFIKKMLTKMLTQMRGGLLGILVTRVKSTNCYCDWIHPREDLMLMATSEGHWCCLCAAISFGKAADDMFNLHWSQVRN